jgi:very-short-patch-repair endonuclease
MHLIISHNSALEYWRKAKAEVALKGEKSRITKSQTKLPKTTELQEIDYRGLSGPLHVLVCSDGSRKVNQSLRCHISSRSFPNSSFLRMGSDLIVSSPELCFLQMAEELSLVELVSLGYEFCGSYRMKGDCVTDRDEDDQGFRKDLPLTCINSLKTYIEKAAGVNGYKNAKRALCFIMDGSASPMETVLAILLTLPYKLGGYGLPKPMLNYRVDVPGSVREPADKSPVLIIVKQKGKITGLHKDMSVGNTKYYCDLYWPDKKVDVEYDSDIYHTGSDRIAKDAIRRNALMSVGVKVVTVSRGQIMDAAKLREVAELLSKQLGKRLQRPEKEFNLRHINLRKTVLPNNNSSV